MTNQLTGIDREKLLEVVETSFFIDSLPDFKRWIRGPVKDYFPHEMLLCAVGHFLGESVCIRHVIGVDCPEECLERMNRIADYRERHIVKSWLSQYRAQIINATDAPARLSPKEQEEMLLLGLTNIAAFGCLDITGKGGTYFSFSRIPGMLTERHAYKLELLMPYLHQTLTRVCHRNAHQMGDGTMSSERLTKRERQILSLMESGLSNRDIAEKLCRSRLTVQNHVHSIFKKLGVRNRVAAVMHNHGIGFHSCDNSRCSDDGYQITPADPLKAGDQMVPS